VKKLAKVDKTTVFLRSFGFQGSSIRLAKAIEELSKAWEAVETFHGTDSEEATRKSWIAFRVGIYERSAKPFSEDSHRRAHTLPQHGCAARSL
jgi:hypothetical protein